MSDHEIATSLPKTALTLKALKGQINPRYWDRLDREVDLALKKAAASILASKSKIIR